MNNHSDNTPQKPSNPPEGGNVYRFADDEPAPAPSLPRPADRPAREIANDDEIDLEPELTEPTRPRRRRRKAQEADEGEPIETEEAPREIGDRILSRPDEERPSDWWIFPTALLGVGALFCLIPIIVMALKHGAGTGAVLTLAAVGAVVLQVVLTSGLLMLLGGFFGIDYGPIPEGLLKLSAVITLVDGVIGGGSLVWPPYGLFIALVLALIVGIALFQSLFKLAAFELLITLVAVLGSASLVVLGLGGALTTKG